MTTRFSIRSRLAALILAATSVTALAGAAQAEDQRIPVGDLSRADAAQAFAQRLDATARTMCDFYANDASRPARLAACKTAVREEALDQLTPVQRAQLQAHADDGMRMAAQDR